LEQSAAAVAVCIANIAVHHVRITYKTLISRPKNGFSHTPFIRVIPEPLFSRFVLHEGRFNRFDTA